MNDLFNQIVSTDNIKQAYFKIIESFDEKSKSNSFSGIDGVILNDYNFNSEKIIKQIQKELIDLKPIDCASKVLIPKKNKIGNRVVFVHTVKERIRCQAVYQIVEPYFENHFSKYLFSYRSKYPSYRAIKHIAKSYRKNYKDKFMLIGDVSNYSDNIDKNILMSKIQELDFDSKTNSLIKLYTENSFLENGEKKYMKKGIVTGLPITVLFNNIYLDEIDKEIGRNVMFYRRVGDDFIIFDIEEKLLEMKNYLEDKLISILIPKDQQKIEIKQIKDKFIILGNEFNNGMISIPSKSIKNIKARWRRKLKYYPLDLKIKTKRLFNILYTKESINNDFIQILSQYNQVNNIPQFKELQQYFMIRLTIYFFEEYSPRNQKRMQKMIKTFQIPSILKYYIQFHSGKKTLEDFK